MAKITTPAKNDLFTLLLAVAAVVFLIGLVMNTSKLRSEYKGDPNPAKIQAFDTNAYQQPAAPKAPATEGEAQADEADKAAPEAAADEQPKDEAAPADKADDAAPADEAKPADEAPAEKADDAGNAE